MSPHHISLDAVGLFVFSYLIAWHCESTHSERSLNFWEQFHDVSWQFSLFFAVSSQEMIGNKDLSILYLLVVYL